MAGGVQAGRLSIEVIAEVARLQADMEKIKRTVRDASGDIAKSTKVANDNLASLGSGISRAGATSKQAAFGMRNLGFQVQDLGVQFAQAAGSSHPLKMSLMALIMQGPQIKDALNQIGKSLFAVTAGFIGAHPVITAVALAAGGAYLAFENFRKGVNAESKAELEAYAASLGLTAKELEKAGGAAVTSGDMLLGLWDVFAEFTGVEKIFADVKGWIVDNIRDAVLDAKKNVSQIYAAFAAAVDGIKAVWKNLPAIIGEGVFAGVNLGIGAIEKLINSAIDGLNTIAKIANPMLALANMAGVNTDIGHVSLGRANNPYAGAGAAAADAFLGSYKSHLAKAEGAFDTFLGKWADAGVSRAKGRLKKAGEAAADEVGKGAKERAAKAGKEAGEVFAGGFQSAFDKGLNAAIALSNSNIAAMIEGNTNVDWAEMLKAANDNLDKLQKPIRDAADEQARWNEQLDATLGYLRQMGGMGSKIADLAVILNGLNTGNLNALPGKAGGFIGMLNQTSFGHEFLGKFEGTLDKFFGGTGQFTEALGAFGLAVQANQMIGDIFGFKGGPLGVFTSLFNKLFTSVPKASATIGVSNGALGIGSVRGNSNSRKTASTEGANSVISALSVIAEAFGVSFGSADVSVGVRKKDYVVDPTGQGRTKGAGVLNFGKDSEAALKAAIADAISDGVFVGLSAGVEKLLKNGDVEKQLQKALSFQSVFDDLSAAKDPAKAAQDAIGKWHDAMAKIFEEAGATADELAKLEELTGIKRADAAKAAAEALLEKERPYREAQIQIMQLEGKTTEALAASRQLELDGMEEGLRPLYQRIYALQDEADTLAKAAELLAQRHELETQLLEILDPVAGARARENDALAALDPSLRDLQKQIWSAKTAADAAATALAEQQRIAKEIADERAGLENTWLQLTGDTVALRAKEREGISETNRALYDQIIAEQDRQAAVVASTKALEDAVAAVMSNLDKRRALTIQLAELLDPVSAEAMRRADILRELEDPILQNIQRLIWDVTAGIDAAAKSAADLKEQTEAWQRTLDQRRSLTIQLADILDPASAEAMRRADTLNAITDPDSRRIQQQIFDAIDATNAAKAAEEELAKQRALAEEQARAAAAAEEARLKRIADARSALIGAYDRESGALQGTIDKFRGFAETITAFREGLIGQSNPGAGYGRTLAQFRSTSAMAGLGSENALGRFNGDAQALLDAAKDRAGSGAEYRRIQAMVLAGANGAIGASSGVANMAQQQLDTMKAQLEGLIDLNEGVVSFAEALDAYRAVSAEQVPVLVDTVSSGLEMVAAKIEAAAVTAQQAQQTAQVAQDTSALALVRIERLLTRVTSEDAIRFTSDETINVNVTNTTPVPVDTTP